MDKYLHKHNRISKSIIFDRQKNSAKCEMYLRREGTVHVRCTYINRSFFDLTALEKGVLNRWRIEPLNGLIYFNDICEVLYYILLNRSKYHHLRCLDLELADLKNIPPLTLPLFSS